MYHINKMRKCVAWASVWSTGSETPELAWVGGCELKEQEHDIKTQQAKL